MIKISAPTIEEALLRAGNELHCSCVDLEYEIIQYPSDGIFGLGKKEAKIVASPKPKRHKDKPAQERHFISIDEKIPCISSEINELFRLFPLSLEKVAVSKYDANTVLIHFKGEDSALLIGEKGYRYKAISYLLFNWINAKYGLNIRLEIETFLANQEDIVRIYLEPIIKEARFSNKTIKTKPLDGILAYIALKSLRSNLPGRYITLKSDEADENYIVISPYNEQ